MMHENVIEKAGLPLNEAGNLLIMMHGRGASASDILGLVPYLDLKDFAILAPQATNCIWYPYSFMSALETNHPWLDSALALMKEMVVSANEQGISSENIYLLGFSQGACLTLEFAARNATRYGGIAAFTGGLIGDEIDRSNYSGDFAGTPVFIGTGNPDPHIPVERVHESALILKEMNANVDLQVYPGREHTVSQEEIDFVNSFIFSPHKA